MWLCATRIRNKDYRNSILDWNGDIVISIPISVDVVESPGELPSVKFSVHGHAKLHGKFIHKLPVHQVRQPAVTIINESANNY